MQEAAGISGLEKTIQIMKDIMNCICRFLRLTMESVLDFDGVLPTLDLVIWVRKTDNKTMYSFFSKPMASSKVLQRDSAMPENMKISTLNQEMIRRMINTSEELDDTKRLETVDEYGMKVVNSGYTLSQTRNIIVGGLKGYERKLKLSRDINNPRWQPLHQGDNFNISGRRKI